MKADTLEHKSPAEFFAENKNIAGFDNVRLRFNVRIFLVRRVSLLSVHLNPALPSVQPGKCLYTTVRELVENSLDAAESISQLPDIDVTMCGLVLRFFLAAVGRVSSCAANYVGRQLCSSAVQACPAACHLAVHVYNAPTRRRDWPGSSERRSVSGG